MAESGNQVALLLRDINILPSIGEILDSSFDYSLSRLHSIVLVKLNMDGIGNPSLRRGSDNLGVVALGNIRQGLHNTLNIHHHSLYCPGNQS